MVSFIGMFTLVHPFATTWHFPARQGGCREVVWF